MQYQVISIHNEIAWDDIVSKSWSYDFYHCSSYNKLDDTGDPLLFVAKDGDEHILLPLIKRAIENTEYFDCSSVYGYAGPLTSSPPELLSPQFIRFFQEKLYQYLSDQKIIAVFSRLHPIISQNDIISGLGDIEQLNKTISIDLEIPLEEQWQQYRKSNKYEIAQLKKAGFVVKQAETRAEIDEFIHIYTETMTRVGAQAMYFFDKSYFYNFLNAKDFDPILLLAYKGKDTTGGAIFTITKNIMQYHLAGTNVAYIKESPMKLIIDEARLLGVARGLKSLHLGGGVGGQDDDDPLYKFKAGFSNQNCRFEVWKYVVDKQIYQDLAEERGKHKVLNNSYFPLYRG
jgi:lipid II:glycine glycyltransferase (peptidoglycan interpeptide bridge formation enzyme)